MLPGSVDSHTRGEMASCRGCLWRLSSPCDSGPSGSGSCGSVSRGCPAGRELLRIWFQPSGGSWQDRGVVCISSGEVITVVEIGKRQRERFERAVPPLVPRCWPPSGVVTNIPIVCGSGQSAGRVDWADSVAGWGVNTWVKPHWTWSFAPGAILTVDQPGGPYPDFTVSHTYRKTGTARVGVETIWTGEFSVEGVGTFSLEPLRQQREVTVQVLQARGLLTLQR